MTPDAAADSAEDLAGAGTPDLEAVAGPPPLPRPLAVVDALQKRYAVLGIPFAVFKKFSDDDAGKLASLVSYYAFLSVFPLLVVLATVLSRVLVGYPDVAEEIVTTAAGSFLSIGATGTTITPLDVSGVALVVAVVVGMWAGLAVANTMQDAMDTVYEVPKVRRAAFGWRILRSLALLLLVGVGLPLTTVLQGFAVRAASGWGATVAAAAGVFVVNTLLISVAFRTATVAHVRWRETLPGAALAALAWSVMQALATGLLTRKVADAQDDYGTFALVVGLLFWLFLLAQVTLYCAELNTVIAYRLWPRGLTTMVHGQADTPADVRSYGHYPAREQQVSNVEVSVSLTSGHPGP